IALARLISAAFTALYVIRPPDSRPQIEAIITIAPPPRLRICGTAILDARTAGKSVWSNASCHSASVVSTMSEPRARPTLLTRMSRPPNVSTVRRITSATPLSVETSACTASTRSVPPGLVRSRSTASAIPASPRAQTVTRHPSSTSAVAMASPRPRVEPVTMATLPSRPSSIGGRSASAASGQVVERPVERLVDHLEAVLLQELALARQQLGEDQGNDRPLDRAAVGEGRRSLVGVGGGEFLLAPGEDRARVQLARVAVDADALGAGRALGHRFGKLLLYARRGERLAAQPAAAGRAAADGEKHPRVVEAGENRLLDLIERDRAPADAVRQPLEGAGNLADALGRIVGRPACDRIVIDHRLEDERVVSVEPERELFVARQLVNGDAGLIGDEAVEPGPFGLQRAVVHVPIPDVEIEQLIERLAAGIVRERVLAARGAC